MGRKKSKHRKPKINDKNLVPETVNSPSALPLEPEAVSSSSALPPETPPPPPWIELPADVTANILQRLGSEEILNNAQKVCTTWWKVCKDPAMWRVIYLRNPEHYFDEYATMCRCAVDRSQGQLVDLTIEYFGDEELIDYIASRSSNLKRLTLRCCYDIPGTSLAEAVKKLTDLEELHLTVMEWVLAEDVKTIGLSCPTLKSFSCNERWSKPMPPLDPYDGDTDDYNENARAIATSMPQLHHLRLFGDSMLNGGLEAILDGCPLLESLDLRQCYKLDLEGGLGKRLCEQIKDVKLPFDLASDIEGLVGGPLDWDDANDYDVQSFGCYGDGDYYDYEQYDDYFSPLGYGFFGDVGHDDVEPDFFAYL